MEKTDKEATEPIQVSFDFKSEPVPENNEVVHRKKSDAEKEDLIKKNSEKEVIIQSPKKTMKQRMDDVIAGVYNAEYREFLSRDALGWLKLSAFYAVFYLWLACFFCSMLFMFWVIRIRGQNLPVYYNTASVMNYKVVNPGLGFRPHVNPESELLYVNTSDAKENIRMLEVFLEEYEAKKNTKFVGAHDEEVNFDYEEILKNSPCSKENSFGLNTESPCVVVKLNRIIHWLPEPVDHDSLPAEVNETIRLVERNQLFDKQRYVYISCAGQDGVDRDNIEDVEYWSSHYSNQIGGIDFKYFPYINQPNYLSPLVFVHFKKIASNTLINVVCKAYAGNIDNDDRLNQRGMVKFQLFVEKKSDNVEVTHEQPAETSESVQV